MRMYVSRIIACAWDTEAAEVHAMVRASTKRNGRGAGVYDLKIAAHAVALDMTLVTSDQAIANPGIKGLRIAEW